MCPDLGHVYEHKKKNKQKIALAKLIDYVFCQCRNTFLQQRVNFSAYIYISWKLSLSLSLSLRDNWPTPASWVVIAAITQTRAYLLTPYCCDLSKNTLPPPLPTPLWPFKWISTKISFGGGGVRLLNQHWFMATSLERSFSLNLLRTSSWAELRVPYIVYSTIRTLKLKTKLKMNLLGVYFIELLLKLESCLIGSLNSKFKL